LGLGTLWERLKLVESDVDSRGRPRTPGELGWLYQGREGNVGHREVTGFTSNAKVETLFGPGSARKHWKDSIYPGELMTSRIEYDEDTISRLTVRALRDIGFATDPTKADPYFRESAQRPRRPKRSRREANPSGEGEEETFQEDVVDFTGDFDKELKEIPKM